jgi:hypothetical protein
LLARFYVPGSQLKCENCGEVTAKSTYVTLSEQVDLPKGHGTAHLVQKVPSFVYITFLRIPLWPDARMDSASLCCNVGVLDKSGM